MTRRNYITAIYVGAMSLLTITACKDRMRLYHKGYKPRHHANLRFDGYYFRKESPMQVPSGSEQSETWANPITPYFFCEDGSIAQYPTHKDEYHI
ncbi:MAG TPA: hypothetical protein VL947_08825, partial [Cytophagales bacterium]|nr:hypothetical protein [Cytophagales bacterium]